MDNDNFQIETEESTRPTVQVEGLPSKTNDVTLSKKFAFKEEDSEATESIGSHEETKNKPISRERTPFISASTHNKNDNQNFNHQFDMYANPKKKITQNESDEGESEEDSSDEESDDDDSEEEEYADNRSENSIQSIIKEQKKPSLSRIELKIKKKDMLLRLHEAEQNGYSLTGKYNMNSDLEEMEAEYQLYEKKLSEKSMIDFFQDGLMLLIKGIEILNGVYNPLNLKLNGLSDKIYDRKESLDHVFRQLAIKYSGGTEMPPELSLIFIIGGAIFMTHLGNTALENGPAIFEKMLGPGMMDNLQGMFSQFTKGANSQAPVAQNAPSGKTSNNPDMTMKPPATDLGNLMSRLMPTPNIQQPKPTKPIDTRDTLPFQAMNVPNPSPFPKSTSTKDVDYNQSNLFKSNQSNLFKSNQMDSNSSTNIEESDRFSVTSSEFSEDDSSITQSVSISIPSKSSKKGRKSNRTSIDIS